MTFFGEGLPSPKYYSTLKTPDSSYRTVELYGSQLKELVEQAMVTTCEVIRDLSRRNACGTSVMGWEFAGCSGNALTSCSGSVSSLLTSTNTVFSCSGASAYGRYLLSQALQGIDLSKVSYHISYPASTTDACGIGDFVQVSP